jgi:hypothetical protein
MNLIISILQSSQYGQLAPFSVDPLPYILRQNSGNVIILCISVTLYIRTGAGIAHST